MHAPWNKVKYWLMCAALLFELSSGIAPDSARLKFASEAAGLHNATLTTVCAKCAHLFADRTISNDQIAKLLRDNDPNIRALAIAALYYRGDTHDLPLIEELCGDQSSCSITETIYFGDPRYQPAFSSCFVLPQSFTVRDFAYRCVATFLSEADCLHTTPFDHKIFAAYWNQRADRNECLSWIAMESDNFPAENWRCDLVRKRIVSLPMPYRAVAMLWITGEDPRCFSNEEVINACRQAGPKLLFRLLNRDLADIDPDLAPVSRRYKDMMAVVLKHTKDLFDSSGKKEITLLRDREMQREAQFQQSANAEKTTNEYLTNELWDKAIAQLSNNPESELLRAFDRAGQSNRNKTELLLEYWNTTYDCKTTADRFYSLPNDESEIAGRSLFWAALLSAEDPPAHPFYDQHRIKPLLKQIIGDERFDKLDSATLGWLGDAVRKQTSEKYMWGCQFNAWNQPNDQDCARVLKQTIRNRCSEEL